MDASTLADLRREREARRGAPTAASPGPLPASWSSASKPAQEAPPSIDAMPG